jgi:hypothetical protein
VKDQAKQSEELCDSLKRAFDGIALISESFMQSQKDCLYKYDYLNAEIKNIKQRLDTLSANTLPEREKYDQLLLQLKEIDACALDALDPELTFAHLLDPITKTFIFGKHKGCSVEDVPKSYLDWLVNNGYV